MPTEGVELVLAEPPRYPSIMKMWLMGMAVGITGFLIVVIILLMFYYRPTFEWVR